MKSLIIKSLLAVGVASGLGLGAAAFAQANTTALPPPTPPAATALADSRGAPRAHATAGRRGPWRNAMRRNRMRRLAHRLHLDKSQRTAILHVHAKAMADIWAARADESLTPEHRGERIKAAVEAGRAEFRNLLTPDQRARLDQIESRRERRLLGL